jgi:hypothetical protein
MKKTTFKIEGHKCRGWKCECGEDTLYTPDAQKILILNKIKHGVSVKVGELGESLIIRFPKEFVEAYKIKKGNKVMLRLKDSNKIEISV